MRRSAALVVGLATLFPAAVYAQAKQDFTLINRTGYTIDEVYVAPTSSDDWQDDVMGQDVLNNGERVNITFPRRQRACNYDVKVVFSDASSSEWQKFNLCETSKIVLRYNKRTGETWAEYE